MSEHIVIVGSGFAGLGMGIRLKRAGMTDFTIFEQASRIGGTWRDNHYPGAACDIESHLYSFSFAPNPGWSRAFAEQREILEYLERCADEHQLRPHLRLDTAVTGAAFDESTGLWTVRTSDGGAVTARVLISGTGGLSQPAIPSIPGLLSFGGATFHTARWDERCDLEGKTVAVIGTGASAIQIVPSIAPRAARLHVYQRTAPWILPKPDRAIRDGERARFARWPILQRLARLSQYLRHELRAVAFVSRPGIMKLGARQAIRFLEASVPDPALRARLRPDYVMGCKRVLLSNDYYPALLRPNVELVTEGIEEITPRGIRTVDGQERAVDALVLATGFHAADAVAPFPVTGRSGRDLNETWQDGAEAFLGTSVSGFPNLFLLVGPNTGLGHNSMVYMIESQITYVLSALSAMRARKLRFIDVKADTQRRYNEELQARFERTVWSTGCRSWYRTASGKNVALWPGYTFAFRRRTRRWRSRDYETVAA